MKVVLLNTLGLVQVRAECERGNNGRGQVFIVAVMVALIGQ